MDARLCLHVGARRADQAVALRAEHGDLVAQPVDHRLLQVGHAAAEFPRRGADGIQNFRMLDKEIRVVLQEFRDPRCTEAGLGLRAFELLCHLSSRYRIDWPVFCQSATKAARPFSVSG